MLLGRDEECARIDALLEDARESTSGALVLRGEAGIGKSALLEYAAKNAVGFTVLQTLGVESEAEIAFAGAQQLLRPVMGVAAELPDLQTAALNTAFALADGPPPERLTFYSALLGLLAAAAEEQPLLCLVDDAQWLDATSAEALAFASRRLHAEGAVVLFAVREPEAATFAAPGVSELRIGPLPPSAARALLAERTPELAARTVERLVELTGGNPLALLEGARGLNEAQQSGDEPLHPPLPVNAAVERAFLERFAGLGADTQQALLLLAAGDPDDAATTDRALAAAGLLDAITEAEGAGLVRPGRLLFSHPLARSSIHQSARPADRRHAHAALAEASNEPDRRAWHLAAAADGPDEQVARALEQAAELARRRGGVAAEARALERAARLTPDDDRRARRLYAAALATEQAGWLEHAESLIIEAAELTDDAELRSEAISRRAYLLFDRGRFDDAYELAVGEANLATPTTAVGGALRPLWRRLDFANALRLADRVRPTPDGGVPDPDIDTQVAWVWAMAGRVEEPLTLIRRSLALADPGTWLAVDCGNIFLYLEHYAAARDVIERAVDTSRSLNAIGTLGYALDQLAKIETRVGDLTRAYALELESVQLTEPLGNEVGLAASLIWLALIEAILGRHEARGHAERGLEIAQRLHDPWNRVRALGVIGLDALGQGDPQAAVQALEPAVATAVDGGIANPNFLRLDADLIEALVHVGRDAEARQHVVRLESQAEATGSDWARSVAGRCRALVSEATFDEALKEHRPEAGAFEEARTRLCYGERLRRDGERRAARAQLRTALESFEWLGAQRWAERARVELRASGAHLRRRDPTAAEVLTPQELQIMLLVAEGLTNRDVATRLFLSPKTVEFHLTRIYRKLGVSSRAELVRRRLATEDLQSSGSTAPAS
jgi:DNA-binding CsgD family transcriptional regulator